MAGGPGGPRWVSMHVCLVLLLITAPRQLEAQQMMPFAGNGEEPSEPTTVYVSTYIDRLMFIDDKNYEFQALVFVYLSWTDPRARKTVAANSAKLAANSSASCKLQCQLYPQNQPNPASGCCDDVWLPYVSWPTLKYLSQDRVMRWGVNIDQDSDTVAYWTITLGTFMAAFNLRAFPFDSQRLNVQMEIPGWAGGNVRLKASSTGTRMFNTNPDGDSMSGWRVQAVRMTPYSLKLCQRYTVASSQPSAPDDPAPLVSHMLYTDKRIVAQPSACAAVLDKNQGDPSFPVYTRRNQHGGPDGGNDVGAPLNVTGLTCTIVVKRYVAHWIMGAIFPIVVSTWLGFVVFLLPRDCINSRLGAIMTIFVAVAAVQFVVLQDLPHSSYITSMQQLIAAAYIVLTCIAVEAVLIWYITTYHTTGRRLAQHKQAQHHFEAGVKDELAALRAKLQALTAKQGQGPQRGPPSNSPLSAMRGLSFRKSFKARSNTTGRPAGSSSTPRSGSNTSTEERAAAAVAAAAAADKAAAKAVSFSDAPQVTATAAESSTVQQQHKSQEALLRAQVVDGDVSSDAPSKQSGNDQGTPKNVQDLSQVLQDVQRLEQHLIARSSIGAVPRPPADSNGSLGSMPPAAAEAGGPRYVTGSSTAAAAAEAAAADDAVLLTVDSGDADPPACSCLPAGMCTRMRLYLSAVKRDETFADRLSYQLNKWIGIVQFFVYNVAVVLIFAINWALYHRD